MRKVKNPNCDGTKTFMYHKNAVIANNGLKSITDCL